MELTEKNPRGAGRKAGVKIGQYKNGEYVERKPSICFTATKEEIQKIKDMARKKCISVSEFIVRSCLS